MLEQDPAVLRFVPNRLTPKSKGENRIRIHAFPAYGQCTLTHARMRFPRAKG